MKPEEKPPCLEIPDQGGTCVTEQIICCDPPLCVLAGLVSAGLVAAFAYNLSDVSEEQAKVDTIIGAFVGFAFAFLVIFFRHLGKGEIRFNCSQRAANTGSRATTTTTSVLIEAGSDPAANPGDPDDVEMGVVQTPASTT